MQTNPRIFIAFSLTLLISFSSDSVYSHHLHSKSGEPEFVISGAVKQAEKLTGDIEVYVDRLTQGPSKVIKITLDNRGNFEVKFPKRFDFESITLRLGDESFVNLVLTNEIHLDIDASKLSGATLAKPVDNGVFFSGTDAALNLASSKFGSILAKLGEKHKLIEIRPGPERPVIQLTKVQFANAVKRLKDYREEAHASLARQKNPTIRCWLGAELDADVFSLLTHLVIFNKVKLEELDHWKEVLKFQPTGLSSNQKQAVLVMNVALRNAHHNKDVLSGKHGSASYVLKHFQDFKFIVDSRILTTKFALYASLYKVWLSKKANKLDCRKEEASLIESGLFTVPPAPIAEHMVDAAVGNKIPSKLRRWMKLALLDLRNSDDVASARLIANNAPSQLRRYVESQIRDDTVDSDAVENSVAAAMKLNISKLKVEERVLDNGAILQTLPEATGTEVLAFLLNSNEGKAVFLDCWGTWCAPCIQGISKLIKISRKLENEPIEFVFVACYSDIHDVERLLTHNDFIGTHIILNDSQVDEFTELLNKNSFPAYALISQERRLVRQDPTGKSADEVLEMLAVDRREKRGGTAENPSAIRVQESESLVPWIRAEVKAAMKEHDIPAVSFGIVVDGEVAICEGLGTKSRQGHELVDEHSVFQIASQTKMLTGIIVNNLIAEERLNIDEPIVTYLRRELNDEARQRLAGIRVKHLLNHTSGIASDACSVYRERVEGEAWENGYSSEQLIADIQKLNPKSRPGESWDYSNSGYAIVGLICENASGQSYKQLLQTYVVDKYSLNSTCVELTGNKKRQMPTPYRKDDRTIRTRSSRMGMATPASGAYSSAADLTKLMRHQISAYRQMDGQKDSMTSSDPLVLTNLVASTGGAGSPDYGFGLFRLIDEAGPRYGHGGDADGFAVEYVFAPKQNTGVVLLTTSGGRWLAQLQEKIFNKLTNRSEPEARRSVAESLLKIIESDGIKAATNWFQEYKGAKGYVLREEEMNQLGYHLLQSAKHKAAIEVFRLNVDSFPKSANVYDSLGEAYLKDGNNELAILNYEKSIAIDGENPNAKAVLKKLKQK